MTETELRAKVVSTAALYVGTVEGSAAHTKIIDTYNQDRPLPGGASMGYDDPWCAAFVSAVFILAGLKDIGFKGLNCDNMIARYKSAGRWQENDAYRPAAGDVIFYDWGDIGAGDCTGGADHVGIVEKVTGNTITTIEGNTSDAVQRRYYTIDARYIRGYGLPDYGSKATGGTSGTSSTAQDGVYTVVSGDTLSGIAARYGTTYQAIAAYNGIADPDRIKVGQIIRIPPKGYTAPAVQAPAASGLAAADSRADYAALWTRLMGHIGNAYGTAALLGSIEAESAGIANNLQDTGNVSLAMSDADYTAAVDNGSYANFVNDRQGYGLCQWTFWSRKKALLDYARSCNASIGNRDMQADFIAVELAADFPAVLKILKNATAIKAASDAVLLKYEAPAQAAAKSAERARAAQKYFDKYANAAPAVQTPAAQGSTSAPADTAQGPGPGIVSDEVTASEYAALFSRTIAGRYKVNAAPDGLNIRDGAGTGKAVLEVAPDGLEVKNFGYYTKVAGVVWLYVQAVIDGRTITGFADSRYLTK